MERDLVAIFEDVLGTNVGVDDTFVSLGGDSLTAAEIAAAVELELGLDLPPALLTESPTVAGLATALAAGTRADVVRLSLLSDGGAGTPLVLVPDHRGQALSYARVARSISSGHPVWAVHLSSQRGVDLSVSAVAASIVSTVRETFADGPVVIGGFCYGALVAGEVARALRIEGRDVSIVLLGLLPSDLPSLVAADALARWRAEAGRRFSVRRIRFHLLRARSRSRRAALVYVAGRVRTVAQVLADRARGRSGSGSLQSAAQPFQPAPHAGSVTLVLGADTVSAYTDDPAAAWAALAEHVEVHVLPGDNAAALREPEQSGLDTVLCGLLREADLRQTVP
jgi:thioesterase domain-containing protein/acyl carrier protein